jgi:hypothetical protein
MSDRYESSFNSLGWPDVTDTVSDNSIGAAYSRENATKLTKELNALQDVIDIAHRYYICQQAWAVLTSHDETIWTDFSEARDAFESAMRALIHKTPKTVEQLLQERFEAADALANYTLQGMISSEASEQYKKAKAAHEKAMQP